MPSPESPANRITTWSSSCMRCWRAAVSVTKSLPGDVSHTVPDDVLSEIERSLIDPRENDSWDSPTSEYGQISHSSGPAWSVSGRRAPDDGAVTGVTRS